MDLFDYQPIHHQPIETKPTKPALPTGVRPNPWQRIGTPLSPEVSRQPALAIKEAKLDWQVERVPLRTADDLSAVPDVVANRRSDTGRILGVVGTDYAPVQNIEVFRFLADLAADCDFSIETAGSFQHGKVIWAQAKLPGLDIRLGDDLSSTYLLIANGHAGNRTLSILPTTVRVICQNTLALAESQAKARREQPGLAGGFALRHTRNIHEAMNQAKEAFAAAIKQQRMTRDVYEHLARVPLTSKLERDFYASLFGTPGPDESKRAKSMRETREQRLAAIMASDTSQVRGTKDTAYSLLQGVVEYADHYRLTRTNDGIDADEARLHSATMGSGAQLKSKAWRAILDLAA